MIERDIFMGDFPLMTKKGTFIINGAERVIVSQIVRSPGAYYSVEIDKTGRHIYSAQVIPYRGAWIEYETDTNEQFSVRIDKNRKIPITVLIRALGIGADEEIIKYFGEDSRLIATMENDDMVKRAAEKNETPENEALKEIFSRIRPGEPPIVESAQQLINNMFFDPKRYDLARGRFKFNKKLSLARLMVCISRPRNSCGELWHDSDTATRRWHKSRRLRYQQGVDLCDNDSG